MKRYLRFCLIFLIGLALPLSGMAGVQAPTEPCPMKTMGMAMMDDMGVDCCNEMKSPSEHGNGSSRSAMLRRLLPPAFYENQLFSNVA